MSPISKEDFAKLSSVEVGKARGGAKVTTDELIEFLKGGAYTTREVAEFLNTQVVSALARLKRLVAKGVVEARIDDRGKLYWTAT